MDRETWLATVHGVAKESDTAEHAHTYRFSDILQIVPSDLYFNKTSRVRGLLRF